jgi:glycosyltransferase involved in cell wall biosynthesis
LRILNVNASLDPLDGGQSERTFQMSRALASAGDDVDVLVTDKGLTPERVSGILPARVISFRTLNRRFYVPRISTRGLRQVVGRQDVIHLMGYWSILNAMVFHAARTLGKPVVLCPAGSLRIFGRSKVLKRAFDLVLGRRMVRDVARLIAITPDEQELFISYGVRPDKITVIPNAIEPGEYADNEEEAFRQKFRIGQRPFILFLGRLNPIKGPDLLLDAYLQANPEVRAFDLIFAGPDEGMGVDLRRRSSAAGLDNNIHFIGHVAGLDKSRALHAASFMVIPSRHEAMSIVVLEAGAAGTPVVVTDRCGLDDVERSGGGFVVAAETEAIRRGLERMAGADRSTMGGMLSRFVLSSFTWASVARQYQDLYRTIACSQPDSAEPPNRLPQRFE